MTRFIGFPDRIRYTPVPNLFLSGPMAEIDDVAELKLTLHVFRALSEMKRTPRLVRLSDLSADRGLLMGLRSPEGGGPEARLVGALDKACSRGTLLGVALQSGDVEDRCYLLNTPWNRDFLRQLERGEQSLGEGIAARVEWAVLPEEERSNIYQLYEQNIGLLTPLIADELREAEATYPPEWIEDAFREAVSYNRRNWRYARRILENWATDGRGEDGKGRRHSKGPGSPSKYLGGKYAHLLQR